MLYITVFRNSVSQNKKLCDEFSKAIKQSTSKTNVKIAGSVGLIEQDPWIMNQTIRENILFGQDLDPRKYNETIEICQLVRDLAILEGGDLTQIGEKGINLSGRQKARVSIARAVYANNDIVLMDDPLSALDAHVKKGIFDKVICGELKDKIRVLATHTIDVLDRVDKIIVIYQGQIIHQGSIDELKDLEYFKRIFENFHYEKNNEEENIDQI